jgi:outer membrane protein OmpA-like peptidoglycan-associated protein
LFQPAIDGDFFRIRDTTTTAEGTFVWRTTYDYSHRPLEYTTWDGQDVTLVGGINQLDIAAGYRFGRFRMGVDLPLLVHGGGDLGSTSFGVGQPFVDGKVMLIDDIESPWGAVAGVRALIPNGDGPSEGLGGPAGVAIEAVGSRQLTEDWRLSANVGVLATAAADLEQAPWGSRLNIGLGQEFQLPMGPTLLTEISTQPVLASLGDPRGRPAELLVGAQVPLGEDTSYALRPAFSLGLGDAAGVPSYRVLLQLRRLPTLGPVDADGDGLVDEEDACPNAAEDMDAYEDADGCPEATQVTVRVIDTDGIVVDDAAWTQGEQSGESGDTVELAAGDYTFAVGEVSEDATVVDGPPSEVVVEIPAPRGDLVVNVIDEEGTPVEGAVWSATGPLDIEEQPGNQLVPVRPGSYALSASAPGYRSAKGEVEVTLDGEATLTLTVLPSKVSMSKTRIDIKDSVYFDTAKALIQQRSHELLDEVAQILLDHPELLLVRIEGHTDDRGNAAYNKELSQSRAEEVRVYMIEQGVAEDRLIAVGYGEEKPLASGTSSEARNTNRRVDFFVEKHAADAPGDDEEEATDQE